MSTEDAFNAMIAKLGETGSAAEAAAVASEFLGSRAGGVLGPALREAGGEVDGLREKFNELGHG